MNDYLDVHPTIIKLYPKSCMGCTRHKKEVMLTIYDGKTFHDVFLTQAQFDKLKSDINSFQQDA